MIRLGKVKKGSQMYPWASETRNPLGGRCQHNCSYCLDGNTKILMSNFEEIPIGVLEEGEEIIGIEKKDSGYRKYTTGTIEKVNTRESKTYLIETENDKIITTPEHPFLGGTSKRNGRDWIKARSLSPYYLLRYVGRPIKKSKKYLKGWLSGYIEGDGCFFDCKNGKGFEAVSVDKSIRDFLINTSEKFNIYLNIGKKQTTKKSHSNGKSYPMVFTRKTEQVKRLQKISKFKQKKSKDFYKGYVGGIFDAEGSIDKCGNMRISNYDKETLSHINYSTKKLSIHIIDEDGGFRLSGSLKNKLKIFKYSNCSRKREKILLGHTIKGTPAKEIKSIKANGKQTVYNLQTSCKTFIANGFIVHNCYLNSEPFSNLDKYQKDSEYLDYRELDKISGEGKTIFICSANDLFGEWVSEDRIKEILQKCRWKKNTYLFQSKNPKRFKEFIDKFPQWTILGTTIETNRNELVKDISDAPDIEERVSAMESIDDYDKMVSVEPIMDFDLEELVHIVEGIQPEFISVGADSKNNSLPEPRWNKVEKLIDRCKEFTEVRKKHNLNRLK